MFRNRTAHPDVDSAAIGCRVDAMMREMVTRKVCGLLLAGVLFAPALLAQLVQQGPKLVGAGAAGNILQGFSAAISADGSTAIVGGPFDSAQHGAAWVWTRNGGTWTQQGLKLVAAEPITGQGTAVALSADGNTAIIGGRDAVWIWTRNGVTWTQQGPALVGTGSIGIASQGSSVALSADGNTAIVGGPSDNSQLGASWIWTRTGGVWSQQGAKLVGSGAVGPYVYEGSSVALSADGNTAMVGGPEDDFAGAAWVFARSGGVWTQQGSKLVGTGSGHADGVALSADGNTGIVAVRGQSPGAFVWTRSGGLWTQQGPMLIGTGSSGGPFFDVSAALSADGNTAMIGAQDDGPGLGASWVWTRSGVSWTQQGAKLVGTGGVGFPELGRSVSLSADGNTAIVGGLFDDGGTGAIWVWTRAGGTWTQQGTKLVGSGWIPSSQQGQWIALSGDGKTLIAGGFPDYLFRGSSWVWTRNGINWSQQGPKLSVPGIVLDAEQGMGVGLSADGSTAIVGGFSGGPSTAAIWNRTGGNWAVQSSALGPSSFGSSVAISGDGSTAILFGTSSGQAAAAVWTRSGVTWAQQGPTLVGSGAAGTGFQSSAVALSADGNTAVVGGSGDGNGQGAAWIWTRSGGVWTQQGPKLIGPGAVGGAQQGYSVAISGDGNTAMLGGPQDSGGQGAVWVWTRSGGSWVQQGAKLVATGAVGNAQQGFSVALSADGNRAIVGAPGDDGQGAAWIWTRNGGNWTQGAKLVGSGAVGTAVQGFSVALSADGYTAAVGGPGDDGVQGAIWIFAAAADLRLMETVTPSFQAVSGPVTFTITVTNGGPSSASSVIVTDSIPAGSSLVSVIPSQGNCSGTATVICSVGTLANQASMTITLVVVAPAAPTTMTNTASVSGAEPDVTPGDNTASASLPILLQIPTLSTALLALLALLLAAVGARMMN
jgi:uncharacterized repeat protein (TIGR01451 family)